MSLNIQQPPEHFRRVVTEAHGHDRYALALWNSRLTDQEIFTASQIPCITWCVLTYDLPVAMDKVLRLRGVL